MLLVVTSSGASNTVPFRVKNKIGTKTYSNKKNFTIAAEVDISNVEAVEKNSLFIKVPLPIQSYSQRDVKVLSINPTPFVADYQGAAIHQYENINSSTKIHIRQEYGVNTYEVNTRINPVNVRVNSRQNKAIYDNYAIATELIPANDPLIQKTAAEIVQNERNPYNKARRIYNYLLKNVEIIPASILNSGASPVNALKEKKGRYLRYSYFVCSSCKGCRYPCSTCCRNHCRCFSNKLSSLVGRVLSGRLRMDTCRPRFSKVRSL